MNRYVSPLLLMAILLGLLAGCRSAGPEVTTEPMSVEDELIAKSIAAQGGEEAIEAVQAVQMTGNALVQGMDLPITTISKRPNMTKRIVDIPAMGMEIVSGFDGEVAWEVNPMMSSRPQKLNEVRTRIEARQASIEGELMDYREKGSTLSYEGEETIGSGAAHKLVLTRADGSVATYYLDAETFLPVRVDGEGVDAQTGATVNVQTTMGNYEEHGGVMWPTTMEIRSAGGTPLTINISEIVLNPEVEDATFAFPGQE